MNEKKVLRPVQKFIKAESFSGILLFFAAILAMIIANSPLSDLYNNIWDYKIGIKSENFELIKPLILWINDGLMAIFFFLIGLEIKREILLGELNSIKKASLPVFAALGGMIIPLSIYLLLNKDPETIRGWGISMATDIAFTLAILRLLGNRIPLGLKIFLTAFAIIDDIGAVLVIAVFYTGEISWELVFIAILMLLFLYFLSFKKIHNRFLLLFFGFIIWLLFLKSGIHPTLAGVLLAFAVPVRQKIDETAYVEKLCLIVDQITDEENMNKEPVLTEKQIEEIDNLEDWTGKFQSPLQQLEHRLHNWVAYLVMPLFAFANAGVSLAGGNDIDTTLAVNIAISLVFGKLIGVFVFSFIGVKTRLAQLPEKVSLKSIAGIALLSGVGFTMSLFIGNLAFIDNDILLNSAKTGIIAGSFIAGISGYLLLRLRE